MWSASEITLHETTVIYVAIGLAGCLIGLVGGYLLRRKSAAQAIDGEALLKSFLDRRPPGPTLQSPSKAIPRARPSAAGEPALSKLEGLLRTAILSPEARERLVTDAMRHYGGDRAAAIRRVLNDLHAENNRWS
jgi:hypothetical protein